MTIPVWMQYVGMER